jgi:hypothetical protein
MNIEDIQDSVRIGNEVSVILRTGHLLSGFLSEIRETSIILRQASGAKMPGSVFCRNAEVWRCGGTFLVVA